MSLPITHAVPDTSTDPDRQRGRTVLLVVLCIAIAVGVGAAGFFSIKAGGIEGAGVSVLYAMLPVPVLVGAYLWLDAYEPEPRRYLATAFVWGAVGAVGIALAIQIPVQEIWEPSNRFSATFLAPMTEEPAKGLILVLAFLRHRRVIDGIVDGFVYAGIAALGFAFTENILYYTSAYVLASKTDIPGAFGATGTFFGRGVMTPFLHPLFTTWFGLAIALAVLSHRRLAWLWYAPIGLALGMLAHGSWNAAAVSGNGWLLLAAYSSGLLILAGLLTWALIARRNEGRLLWNALTDMANRRGWLNVEEVPYLARLGLRKRARSYAKRTKGTEAMRAVKAYQKDTTQLAFLYDSVMRGRPRHRAVERADQLRHDLAILKPQIVLPPPVRIVKRLPRPRWPGYPAHGRYTGPGAPLAWQAPPQPGPPQGPPIGPPPGNVQPGPPGYPPERR